MIAKSVPDVLARCERTPTWTAGMCGQFCAVMFGYGASGYRNAVTQWAETPTVLRRPGDSAAPAGALLYWSGGSAGHGHVAVSAGHGTCWSIDISGTGTVSRVPVGRIRHQWGLPYLGWAYPYIQGKEWSPAMIYGVDVAVYQSGTVADTLPGDGKDVSFAITKATQGTTYVNPRMSAQAASAREQGMIVGFYHFLEKGNIQAQAEYFVDRAVSVEGDILACDWETNPNTNTYPSSAEKDAFIRAVQKLRPGHRVLLYCNTSFWKNIDSSSFAGDGLWIATAGYAAGKPPIQSEWVIHQYSTAGGIDHDVAQFENQSAMRAWAGGDDVALTADDKAWILANVPKAVLTTDGILEAPADALAADPANTHWTLESYVKDTGSRVRQSTGTLADIHAQTRTTGSGITALAQSLTSAHMKLDVVKAVLEGLNLDDLPAEIAAKLNGLKFVLEEN